MSRKEDGRITHTGQAGAPSGSPKVCKCAEAQRRRNSRKHPYGHRSNWCKYAPGVAAKNAKKKCAGKETGKEKDLYLN